MSVAGHHLPIWFDEAVGPAEGEVPVWNPATSRFESAAVVDAIPSGTYVPMNVSLKNVRAPPYNAVGDGVVDDTAAIVAARAAGVPYLPEGRYKVTSAITSGTAPLMLAGDGPRKSVLVTAGAASTALSAGGTRGTAVALTVNAAAGATALTVASAVSGLVAGDFILIHSDRLWPTSDHDARCGELARVLTAVGTAITLTLPIEDDYAVADASVVQKVTMVEGVHISGVGFENPTPGTKSIAPAISLAFCRDVVIRDVLFDAIDGPAIELGTCVNWLVDGATFIDLADDPLNDRYGYGVSARDASRDGKVTRCHMDGGRHLFTTAANGPANNTESFGVPRHISVDDCTATNTTNYPFDTHFEGIYISFNNCRSHQTKHGGFDVRAAHTSLTNCRATRYVGAGLYIQQAADHTYVDGFRAHEGRRGTVNDVGVPVSANGSGIVFGPFVRDSYLADILIERTDDQGIYVPTVGTNAYLRFSNVTIDSAGLLAGNQNGVHFSTASGAHVGSFWRDVLIRNTSVGFFGSAEASGVDVETYRTVLVSLPVGGGMAVSQPEDFNMLRDAGQEVLIDRRVAATASIAVATGELYLSYFRSRKAETITKIRTVVRGVAASGGTVNRIGLYTVDANGDLTLVASTTHDGSLWNGTFAPADKLLAASYALKRGATYAVGIVFVGTTGPTFYGTNTIIGTTELEATPRQTAKLTGQTILPASILNASLTATSNAIYSVVLP